MNFDPAVAAQEALARAYAHDSLGEVQPDIEEAEETVRVLIQSSCIKYLQT